MHPTDRFAELRSQGSKGLEDHPLLAEERIVERIVMRLGVLRIVEAEEEEHCTDRERVLAGHHTGAEEALMEERRNLDVAAAAAAVHRMIGDRPGKDMGYYSAEDNALGEAVVSQGVLPDHWPRSHRRNHHRSCRAAAAVVGTRLEAGNLVAVGIGLAEGGIGRGLGIGPEEDIADCTSRCSCEVVQTGPRQVSECPLDALLLCGMRTGSRSDC